MAQAAVGRAIAEVLRDCQKTFASHKRGIKTLKKIQKNEPEAFPKQFIPLINRLLIIFKREPSVERLIQFIITFATTPSNTADHADDVNASHNSSNGDDYDFALLLLSYLLEYTNVKEKAVRFRTCQLVAGIVNALSESAEIE